MPFVCQSGPESQHGIDILTSIEPQINGVIFTVVLVITYLNQVFVVCLNVIAKRKLVTGTFVTCHWC